MANSPRTWRTQRLKSEDVALVVPHQANLRIIRAHAGTLGLPDDKVMATSIATATPPPGTIPLGLPTRSIQANSKKGDLCC